MAVTENNEQTIHSTCPYCGVGCGVKATQLKNGRWSVQGDENHPANFGKLCVKGSQLGNTLDLEGRLLTPKINGQVKDWDSTLDHVADKIAQSIKEHGPDSVAFYLSGQLLTEDYYVANKLLKGFVGTSNVDTNSRLCMSSAVVAYKRALGADAVPVSYEDIEETELMVLVGSNAAWTHPILFQRMQASRANKPGYKVVTIDPRQTATSAMADLHLAIRPGTDAILFNGLLGYLHRHNKMDHNFVADHTDGFYEALAQCPDNLTDIALTCGVPETQLRRFYDWFANSKKAITFYSMGINQSESGVDKCNAIINVHLASGKIGKIGSGPFSITGQPNAMGGREVGGLATMLAAHMDFDEPSLDRVKRFWNGENMVTGPGLPAVKLFDAIDQGKIKVLWIMATNPAVSMPNGQTIESILEKCETLIVSDCIEETDTSRFADVLLPAAGWGEKDGTVTNSERRISRQKGFLPLPAEVKPDWWIISQVAKRLGFEKAFDYQHPYEIFAEHAALSGFENEGTRDFDISFFESIDRLDYDKLQPVQWPVPKWAHQQDSNQLKDGKSIRDQETLNDHDMHSLMGTQRLFEDNQFYTPNKKARFIPIEAKAPELELDEQTVVINSGRLRDQWHTMTRTAKAKKLNQHVDVPFVSIHPKTMSKFKIEEGSLVKLSNHLGEAYAIANGDLKQKLNEVFLPIHWTNQFASKSKVNQLVSPKVDPISAQPAFKHASGKLESVAIKNWLTIYLRDTDQKTSKILNWIKEIKDNAIFYCDTHMDWGTRVMVALNEEMQLNQLPVKRLDKEKVFTYTHKSVEEHSKPTGSNYQRVATINNGEVDEIWVVSESQQQDELGFISDMFVPKQTMEWVESQLLNHKFESTKQMVCSCFQVSETTINQYIADQNIQAVEELTQGLKAGGNCGSCIPELTMLLKESKGLVESGVIVPKTGGKLGSKLGAKSTESDQANSGGITNNNGQAATNSVVNEWVPK